MPTRRTSVAVLALLGLGHQTVEPAQAQMRNRDAVILGIGAAILGGAGLIQNLQAQPRDDADRRARRPAQPRSQPASERGSQQTLAIQQALVERGFDVPLDGQLGPATRRAISAYQRTNGIPATGRLTPQQAQALLAGPAVAAGSVASGGAPALVPPAVPVLAEPPAPAAAFVGPAIGAATPQAVPVSTASQPAGPRALPIGPDAPEWASGTWSGTFPCRRRTYAITLKVPVTGRGEPAILDYRWTGSGTGPASGQGRVVYEAVTHRGLDSSRTEAGEPDHPFRQLRLTWDSEQNPVFVSAPCRDTLPLVRDPRTAPTRAIPAVGEAAGAAAAPGVAQARPAPPAAPSPAPREPGAPSYFGRWQAELACERGQKHRIEVTLGRVVDLVGPPTAQGRIDRRDYALVNADRPGRVAAQVESFAMRGNNAHVAWTRFIGEAEPDGRGIRFASVSNSGQIGELRLRELKIAAPAGGGATLDLDVTAADVTCAQVTLRRLDPLGAPQRPAVRIPPGGGTFYQARDVAGRCQALAEWGSRLDSDLKTQVTQYRPIDPGVLFADTEFIPVFGRPFDLAGETTLRQDALTAFRECQRDPLTRPRMQGLDRVARPVLSDSSWSQDDVYVAHSIRKSRAALNTLAAAQAASTANPDQAAGVVELAQAKEAFRTADVALFPSRREEIVARIEEGLSQRAAQILDREIDRAGGKPPTDVIAYVRDTRALSSPLTANIRGPQRDRAAGRLLAIETQAASAFMSVNLAALAATPATLAGIRRIDALPVAATLPALSPALRAEHEKRWTTERAGKIEAALGSELTGALSLPAGRAGLVQGAEWFAAFARNWQGYLDEAPVKAALDRFFADRKARLLASTDEFRAAIAGLGATERRDAIAGFLVMPQDRKSPAALEYDLIAVGL